MSSDGDLHQDDDYNDNGDDEPPLLDPSLLAGLDESQRADARAAAASARRAEPRAEERRALAEAVERRRRERQARKQDAEMDRRRTAMSTTTMLGGCSGVVGIGVDGGITAEGGGLAYLGRDKRGAASHTSGGGGCGNLRP